MFHEYASVARLQRSLCWQLMITPVSILCRNPFWNHKKIEHENVNSRLLGHGMGALYLGGVGTRKFNRFGLSRKRRSNLSPLAMDLSLEIAATLSRQGIYSLIFLGHSLNLSTLVSTLISVLPFTFSDPLNDCSIKLKGVEVIEIHKKQ